MLLVDKVWGIDYGSKMAGTTVIAYAEKEELIFHTSGKSKDADRMILDLVNMAPPQCIAIDAPLSLPGVYTYLPEAEDYFYRQCDRQLKAMSPMFLGGLTARAMKLSAQLNKLDIETLEVYPVKAGMKMGLAQWGYRKKDADLAGLLNELLDKTGLIYSGREKITGHHIDALLAYHIGCKYLQRIASSAGNGQEGRIYY